MDLFREMNGKPCACGREHAFSAQVISGKGALQQLPELVLLDEPMSGIDAASVSFMDLSVEAECFGATICVSDDEVPTVKGRLINDMDEAEALEIPEVGSCRSGLYVDVIKKAADLITDRPIFAGTIGPFSLAARLLDVSEIMMDCYDEPELLEELVKDYLNRNE